MTLLSDIYIIGKADPNKKPVAKKGEKVKLVSDHNEVVIVEGKDGLRFSVNREGIE